MTAAYQVETHVRQYQGRAFVIENRTPAYRWEERDTVKKDIEKRLYEVFRKYAPYFCEEGSVQ